MAHRKVFATESGRYGTRMLTAGDPMRLSGPVARAMIALGRVSETPLRQVSAATPAPSPAAEDLTALRLAYFTKTGKRAFNGWPAATLREKIAAA